MGIRYFDLKGEKCYKYNQGPMCRHVSLYLAAHSETKSRKARSALVKRTGLLGEKTGVCFLVTNLGRDCGAINVKTRTNRMMMPEECEVHVDGIDCINPFGNSDQTNDENDGGCRVGHMK